MVPTLEEFNQKWNVDMTRMLSNILKIVEKAVFIIFFSSCIFGVLCMIIFDQDNLYFYVTFSLVSFFNITRIHLLNCFNFLQF
jgi:hypothetical protein